MKPTPKLSVIVVTWNVRELLRACLDSLFRSAHGIQMEVIIVDNASSDGTVDMLAQSYPDVRVLANRENVGFPLANNQALVLALGEYVLFLNPDTEVGSDTIAGCIAALDGDAGVGMVGCKLVLEDGTVQPECARRPYLLRHLAAELLYLHMLFPRSRIGGDHLMTYWDHEGERDVEAISGAFMMVRREIARDLGGLPTEIFMYHEDLAFCLRLRRAGWRIRYLGQFQTLHRWQGSSRKSSARLILLEGVYKLQLIREAQGAGYAAAGRALFAIRCASRLVVGGLLSLLVGWTGLARRYPRVLDWRAHGLQLVQCVAPRLVEHLVPRAQVAHIPRGENATEGRKSIVVIGPVPPPYHGGSVATSFVLASELRERWRVVHLDISDRRGLSNIGQLDARNVVLALRHAAALMRLLITERPAVVYMGIAQNTLAVLRDATFVLPALMARSKVVLHVHGGGFRGYYESTSWPIRALLRYMMRKASRVIVLGESLRVTVEGVAPQHQVVVLPNGTPDLFRPVPGRAVRAGAVRVLFLGNLFRLKGVFDVIAAVTSLRARGLDIELDVGGGFGGPGERDELMGALAQLGSAARLHGVVGGARKRELLAAVDMLAFPSRATEAHPYVVLEAMAAGLPVIATPQGAITETVVDRVTGLIVPAGDGDALAAAIAELALDADLRKRLGAAARERFEEKYSLSVWSRGLCAIMEQACA